MAEATSVDIVIRTRAELAGAEKAALALERQIGSAKAAGKSYEKLEAQLVRMRGTIEAFKKSSQDGSGGGFGEAFGKMREELVKMVPALGPVLGFFEKMGGGLVGGIAAAGTAAAGALFAIKKSIFEYAGAEKEIAKLDAALAQNGLLTDEYREKLQELAGELEKATSIADDQWLGVLRTLTQFGADDSNISSLADGVKNLAGIMGGDLQSASMLVARAVQGNFDLFKRYGIVVDENASKQEKLKSVMQQLALRGGGQLEAQAKTLSGQWENLKNQFGNFFEAIGGWISKSKLLQTIIGALANIAEYWAEKLGDVVPQMEGLTNATQSNAGAMEDAEAAQKRYNTALQETENRAKAIVSAMNNEIAAIQKKRQLQDEQANAQMAADLAKVDYQEQLGPGRSRQGGISKEEAIRRRFNIRQGYAEQAFKREIDEKEAIKKSAQVALDKQKAEKARMEAEVKAFEDLMPVAKAYEEKKEKWRKWVAEQSALKEEEDKLINEFEEATTRFSGPGFGAGPGGRSVTVIQADLDALNSRKANIGRQVEIANAALKATQNPGKSTAQIQADLAAGRQRIDKFTETIQPDVQQRNKEISQANAEIASRTKVREAERMTAVYTAATQAGAETDKQAKAAVDAIKNGNGRVINAFGSMASSMEAFNARMVQIEKQVSNLRNP